MSLLTKEQIALINKPLPAEAIKDHPTKKGMSTIKAIFVTDRLNEVFGIGGWQIRTREISTEKIESVTLAGKDRTTYMCVTHTIFSVPKHDIYYECIAGSSNDDCGDAYKGSTTDAITKVGSYLGIGADIWRGNKTTPNIQQAVKMVEQKLKPILKVGTELFDKCRAGYLKDERNLTAIQERYFMDAETLRLLTVKPNEIL
jgi:hypothetical protein